MRLSSAVLYNSSIRKSSPEKSTQSEKKTKHKLLNFQFSFQAFGAYILQECGTADCGSRGTCTILRIIGMCWKITENWPENSSAIEVPPFPILDVYFYSWSNE